MTDPAVRPRRGRPTTHAEPAYAELRAKVSNRERRLAEQAARREGRTLSAWVREVVREQLGID